MSASVVEPETIARIMDVVDGHAPCPLLEQRRPPRGVDVHDVADHVRLCIEPDQDLLGAQQVSRRAEHTPRKLAHLYGAASSERACAAQPSRRDSRSSTGPQSLSAL